MSMKRLSLLLLILCTGCNGGSPEKRDTRAPGSAHKTPAGLKFRDMAGKPHDIDSLLGQGQSVALIFWQTWCKPCLREMPDLVKANRRYSPRIRFYGIISGPDKDVDEAKVKNIVGRLGVGYPQVRDRDLRLSRSFDVEGTPTIVILGPGGSILYRGHRPPDNWNAFAKQDG